MTALEGDSLRAEPLLKLARRFANAVGDSDVEEWLGYELAGYPAQVAPAVTPFLDRVGRSVSIIQLGGVTAKDAATGGLLAVEGPVVRIRRESLPQIEEDILPRGTRNLKAYPMEVAHSKQVHASNAASLGRAHFPGALPKIYDASEVEATMKRAAAEISQLDRISKGVRSELHRWVSSEYHRLGFEDVATATFASYKAELDRVLMEVAPVVADKIPSVYDRLRAAPEEAEAASQAMNTCRRMIQALADALYPASDTPVRDGAGIEHRVTEDKPRNRLVEYIRPRCGASRFERLRKTLDIVFDKTSGGLKAADLPLEEAEPLFLLTYLTLGEIASLPQLPKP